MGKRNNRSRNKRSGKRDQNSNQNQNSGRANTKQGGKRKRTIPFDPDKHFLPDPIPERDYEPCVVSGEEIDDIFTAIADPQTGKPARFDKVIEKIAAMETLKEDERIAYIGRGCFGVVAMEKGENNRPRLVVRKRIEYEMGNVGPEWRKELSPGISRDYPPRPEPLADLYSIEEIRGFPRFDSPISGGTARGN